MKIQTLFDLLRTSQDLLLAFDGVMTVPQLVSRLEKLKRSDVDGLLEDVESLRDAVDTGLTDTIEMSGYQVSGDDNPDDLQDALNALSDLDLPEGESGEKKPENQPPVAQDVNKENSSG